MASIQARSCNHPGETYTPVCQHVFDRSRLEGSKRFTGQGVDVHYLCEPCRKASLAPTHGVCEACVAEIEEEGDWSVEGMPGIKQRPQDFTFSSRTLAVECLQDDAVLAHVPLADGSAALLLFTARGRLLHLDLISGAARAIAEYSDDLIRRQGTVALHASRDGRFAALTSAVHGQGMTPSNRGILITLATGEIVMHLECGDYHTEHTELPVAFVEHQGKTLLIHGTDWARLDITDPASGQCLSTRDFEELPKEARDESVFTEWNGPLLISPDQRWIATIGWVWHPVGVAYSWDLQEWLAGSLWEADVGRSKVSYAMWPYFWFSPFCWLDAHTLCIWGYSELHTDDDIPLPSAAVYAVPSGELVRWFAGPTADVFYFDRYLFSGTRDGDGISVWSVEDGALLCERRGINAQGYHPGTQEFVSFGDQGELTLHHWQGPG